MSRWISCITEVYVNAYIHACMYQIVRMRMYQDCHLEENKKTIMWFKPKYCKIPLP